MLAQIRQIVDIRDAGHAPCDHGRELLDARLRDIEQQVMVSAIQAYVNVTRDLEILRIRQENLTVLQRQLEETSARFEVGEITRTDVAQAEASQAQSEADLANAQAQLSNEVGVNLDEELVNMTTFQQAYNASARLIQAASDMYDTLIGMLR